MFLTKNWINKYIVKIGNQDLKDVVKKLLIGFHFLILFFPRFYHMQIMILGWQFHNYIIQITWACIQLCVCCKDCRIQIKKRAWQGRCPHHSYQTSSKDVRLLKFIDATICKALEWVVALSCYHCYNKICA